MSVKSKTPQLETVHHYAGVPSFYRAPLVDIEDLPEGSVACLGVPLDSWTLGRNGQRMAPRAIREQSLYLAGYYGLQAKPGFGYVNVEDGSISTMPDEPRVFDVGDVRLHQADPQAQTESIASAVAAIVERGAMPLVLGGDHYVPYPSYLGFVRGMKERKPDLKVGFLNFDGHFDLWDEFKDMGRYNHGTFARRISEVPETEKMVWWGLNGTLIAEPDQIELCRDRGFAAYTVDSIRKRGIQETIREALEIASDGADVIYVTFDIDATDGAFAPGTHSMVVEGLTSGEVLKAVAELSGFEKLGAFDVCEMIPQYDVGGGRTARYACHVILAAIGDKFHESKPGFSSEDMSAVFR
jgi:agmatinase